MFRTFSVESATLTKLLYAFVFKEKINLKNNLVLVNFEGAVLSYEHQSFSKLALYINGTTSYLSENVNSVIQLSQFKC